MIRFILLFQASLPEGQCILFVVNEYKRMIVFVYSTHVANLVYRVTLELDAQ
jgi:hypothetical protein